MHAVEDGGAPDEWHWDATDFELPSGKYAVEQMDIDGRAEWTGLITFPDGRTEDSMVQAYRFRRV